MASGSEGVESVSKRSRADASSSSVSQTDYYRTYHGHEVEFLEKIVPVLRKRHKSLVWFAGDSSLDNKYWLSDRETQAAINGYEEVLTPPRMKEDVCYWLNRELNELKDCQVNGGTVAAVNTSIEATTLGQRMKSGLLEQDSFLHRNIQEDDYLIVSVGGNDIALAPTLPTILSMLILVYVSSDSAIRNGSAWGLGHFLKLFQTDLTRYLEMLLEGKRVRKVFVCMIYFPDEATTGSWADTSLGAMKYNSTPKRLQGAIQAVFDHAISKIKLTGPLEGVEVVPFALYSVLNGQDSSDYVQRVEPSSKGGRKMAEAFKNLLLAHS